MKTLVNSPIRPLLELRPKKVLPRRYRVRLIRRGRWVQARYDDGSELTGVAVLAKFDRWLFGTREVTILEDDGRPFTLHGHIPPAQQFLEVAVEVAAPSEVTDRIAAFVQRVDPQHRRVELRHDDEAVRQVEQQVLWRWRLWHWLRRVLN